MRSGWLLLFIVFAACSSRMHPVDLAQVPVQDDVTVHFRYLGNEGKMMIFDVEVKNGTDEIVYMDPERITYQGSYRASAPYAVSPRDPHPLSEYDVSLRLRSKIRSKDMFKLLIGAAAAGLEAYGGMPWAEALVPGIGSNRELITATTTFATTVANSAIDNKKEQLEEDMNYIPSEMLSKHALKPGETLQRKVFFEQIPRMKFYEFSVPVEDKTFDFSFTK